MFKILSTALLSCSLLAAVAGAAAAAEAANCVPPTLEEANKLLSDVGVVRKVEASPVEGLWLLELEKDGHQGSVFMDCARKNLIAGTVFPLGKPSAPYARKPLIDLGAIPLGNSIVLGNPKGSMKLIVFTDPDCPFCKKLHEELKKVTAVQPELAIYVKMLPLRIHPSAYDKARAILTAGSADALDRAFAGLPLPEPKDGEMKKAVDDSIKLAASLGITSTPALILPDGRVIVGFRDADSIKTSISRP